MNIEQFRIGLAGDFMMAACSHNPFIRTNAIFAFFKHLTVVKGEVSDLPDLNKEFKKMALGYLDAFADKCDISIANDLARVEKLSESDAAILYAQALEAGPLDHVWGGATPPDAPTP